MRRTLDFAIFRIITAVSLSSSCPPCSHLASHSIFFIILDASLPASHSPFPPHSEPTERSSPLCIPLPAPRLLRSLPRDPPPRSTRRRSRCRGLRDVTLFEEAYERSSRDRRRNRRRSVAASGRIPRSLRRVLTSRCQLCEEDRGSKVGVPVQHRWETARSIRSECHRFAFFPMSELIDRSSSSSRNASPLVSSRWRRRTCSFCTTSNPSSRVAKTRSDC